jgi:hypothetical protein
MTLTLGDYIGFDESVLHEFKEFTLKIDPISFFDLDDIKEIITTGKLPDNFNDIIIHNLIHYFKFYLPKYISAFGNTKCEESNGNLYVGVNDYGEITGIPFIGTLEKDLITDIKDAIKIFLHTHDLDDLMSQVNFEIIKLKCNTLYLDDQIDEFIALHMKKYKTAKDAYQKFLKDQRNWIDQIEHLTVRMSTFITNPIYRKEVAQFIRSKTSDPNYIKIAEQLEGDHEFTVLTGAQITEQKNDMNNVYHWVTNFKDVRLDYVRSVRPSRIGLSLVNPDEIYPHLFQMLSCLRKRLIENNNINYYLIKITMPTNYKDHIQFTNIGNRRIYSKIRDIIDGNPCCV